MCHLCDGTGFRRDLVTEHLEPGQVIEYWEEVPCECQGGPPLWDDDPPEDPGEDGLDPLRGAGSSPAPCPQRSSARSGMPHTGLMILCLIALSPVQRDPVARRDSVSGMLLYSHGDRNRKASSRPCLWSPCHYPLLTIIDVYDTIVTEGGRMDCEHTDWLTPEELADLMRVHRQTIYRELRAGRLPGAIKIGRQWRISREAMVRALADKAGSHEEES